MTVATAPPFTTQRMIPMPWLQAHARCNALHHCSQLFLKHGSFNPLSEITPKLAF
jgi:hypothetical protein